jgi:hypothetical protein
MRGSACDITFYENGTAFGPFFVNNANYADGVTGEDVDEVGAMVPVFDGYVGESGKITASVTPTVLSLGVFARSRQKLMGSPQYANYTYAVKAVWRDKTGPHKVELVNAVFYDHSISLPPGTQRSDQNFSVAGDVKQSGI